MPRGEHLRKVEESVIRDQFKRGESVFGRKLYTPEEIASLIPATKLEYGDSISGQAIRQRLRKMDGVEEYEMGGRSFWKLEGEKVFLDGGDFTTLRQEFVHFLKSFYPVRALGGAAAVALLVWFFSGSDVQLALLVSVAYLIFAPLIGFPLQVAKMLIIRRLEPIEARFINKVEQ